MIYDAMLLWGCRLAKEKTRLDESRQKILELPWIQLDPLS